MNLNKIKKTSNNLKQNISAFTLIELLVGITIITIILLGSTSINYNRINNKQKLELFTHSIKLNFETIRNNTLSGKGVGINLDIPEKWRINYSKTNSGTIESSSYDGNNWSTHNSIHFQNGYYISEIRCLRVDGTVDGIISGIATIEFNGINLTLDPYIDCDSNTSKLLELTINYKNDERVLEINTLNGLINLK